MFQALPTATLKRALLLIGFVASAAAQGCTDSSSATRPPDDNGDPTGTYRLRSVDGHNIPFQISRSPYYDPNTGHFYNELDVTAADGTVELDELGHIDIWTTYTLKGDGVPLVTSREIQGSYEVDGDQVKITYPNLGSETVSFRNGQITVAFDLLGKGTSNNYVFKR